MIFICSTDKTVIRRIHHIPDAFYLAGNLIHIFLGTDSCFLCFFLNLLSMLVRSGLKIHVITFLSLKPCNAVRQHDLISVADMRLPRCVGDCSRDIIFFLVTFCAHIVFLLLLCKAGESADTSNVSVITENLQRFPLS